MKMSSHLTGKRLKSSSVGEPERDFFTLNIKITHQDRKGLSTPDPLRALAGSHPPPLSWRIQSRRRGRPPPTCRPRGLQRGPACPLPRDPTTRAQGTEAHPTGESRPATTEERRLIDTQPVHLWLQLFILVSISLCFPHLLAVLTNTKD